MCIRDSLIFVATGAADTGVEAMGGDGVEERSGLQPVSHAAVPGVGHPTGVDRLLHRGDEQTFAQLLDAPVAEVNDLGEVVPGVDVHHRERQTTGAERLFGPVSY